MARTTAAVPVMGIEDQPDWYRDAIIYQTHVRAFFDADGDGIGDFRGLTDKLDYVAELGVTALWLMPFYKSPLRDDGYDIADYTKVHDQYGSVADFRRFLNEAHRRGLRVITEMVLNHTSEEHPWFQRARRAPKGSRWRDFYVWSDSIDRYRDARIIFTDYESSNWTWDPVAGQYFWHRFYSHQPDLNYDNPEVHKAVFKVLDFWLSMGVDGMRLDAIPYLYQRDGTSCENLPETHRFLKDLRRHVDDRFPNRMLLAEANQWPEDAVEYFGDGDECHMAFHFPVMPRLFMAMHQGNSFPIVDILQETPTLPEGAQWATFLRNHDELTLEMVTDEERDYMYRVYAHDPQARVNLGIRRRLSPLLGNDRRKIELMHALLFSLPGTPVLYYGDEIGMGDNIYLGDRDGVRTPMQWSADRNAGFSRANPQRLFLPVIVDPEYHYEAINVEAEGSNLNSQLWWTKRLVKLCKRHKALSRGDIEFLETNDTRVLAFLRRYENETILVVANLSSHANYVELDLADYKGMVPIEVFGQATFPAIGELTYLLTLGSYAFYWMQLRAPRRTDLGVPQAAEGQLEDDELPGLASVPRLNVRGRLDSILKGRDRELLEGILPDVLMSRRWFRGKARQIQAVSIRDVLNVSLGQTRKPGPVAYILIASVIYSEGESETYVMPVMLAAGERADQLIHDYPDSIIARLVRARDDGVLYSAFVDQDFDAALLATVLRRKRWKGMHGEAVGRRNKHLNAFFPHDGGLEAHLSRAEQSNTSIIFGDSMILKLYRKIEPGLNPELEIGWFLTDRAGFERVPKVLGEIEYRPRAEQPYTLAILQELVDNQGDAWEYTLAALDRYFDRVFAATGEIDRPPVSDEAVFDLAEIEPPEDVAKLIGSYLHSAAQIGELTAQMHKALAGDSSDPAFAPEAFSRLDRRALYQSMRTQSRQALSLLRRQMKKLPESKRELGARVLENDRRLQARFASVRDQNLTAMRARIHGDYHLGQLLYTGRDFVALDFEGEPARALSERRIKRSPLRDVAGMLRSFDYAAAASVFNMEARGVADPESEVAQELEAWGILWRQWVSAAFLRSYRESIEGAAFLPDDEDEFRVLLSAYALEKAVYEVAYELNNRPDWVQIPLRGILELLDASEA